MYRNWDFARYTVCALPVHLLLVIQHKIVPPLQFVLITQELHDVSALAEVCPFSEEGDCPLGSDSAYCHRNDPDLYKIFSM